MYEHQFKRQYYETPHYHVYKKNVRSICALYHLLSTII